MSKCVSIITRIALFRTFFFFFFFSVKPYLWRVDGIARLLNSQGRRSTVVQAVHRTAAGSIIHIVTNVNVTKVA